MTGPEKSATPPDRADRYHYTFRLSTTLRVLSIVAVALALGLMLWFNRGIDLRAALPELVFFIFIHGLSTWLSLRLSGNQQQALSKTSLIPSALALGFPQAMIVGLVANLLVGSLALLRSYLADRQVNRQLLLFKVLWNVGTITLSLMPAAWAITRLHDAVLVMNFEAKTVALYLLVAAIYCVMLSVFYFGWIALSGGPLRVTWHRHAQALIRDSVMPILFAPVIVLPYHAWPELRLLVLALFVGGVLLFHTLDRLHLGQIQHMDELHVLNSIGQALTARLELDELNTIIRDEIGKLFDVSGFYLGLYDRQANTITFPVVYEAGREIKAPPRPFNEKGLTEHIIQTGQPLVINQDVAAQARKMGLEVLDGEPYSFLGVPVMFDQEVLGVLGLENYDRAYYYTPQDVQLLQTIAAQTGIALHNAYLYRQSQRQAAELSTLSQISSLLHVTPVLDEMLTTICKVTANVMNCQKAAIFLLDEESDTLRLVSDIGLSEAYRSESRAISMERSCRTSAVRDGVTLSIEDVLADSRFADVADLVRQEGFRAALDVPLHVAERVIGLFTAYYDTPRHFDGSEIALMETLGTQVAIAIENAHLFAEMRARTQEMEALYQANMAINASLSLRNVLQAVAISALQALNTESCTVLLTRNDRMTLDFELRMVNTVNGIIEEPCKEHQMTLDELPVVGKANDLHKPVIIHDGQSPLLEPGSPFIEQYRVQSGLILPLVSYGNLVGLILVGEQNAERIFKEQEIRLATALANQAAVTIQNARLFEHTDFALAKRVDELSTLETLAQRMTSRLDLEDVIEQVVAAAMSSTGADFGEVALLDEQKNLLRTVARRSVVQQEDDEYWPAMNGITGRSLRLGHAITVADVEGDPDYINSRSDMRSELAVPIILDERRLGVINLESTRYNAFSADHVRLVGNLAEYAAIAIQNARLFEAAQRRADEFRTLQAIALELLSSTDVTQSLRVIAREALAQIKALDIHIYLYDQARDQLTFGTSLWASGEVDREFAKPRPHGMTAKAARSGERIVIADPTTHELTADMQQIPGWELPMVSVPLKWGDRVVGVFNFAFAKDAAPDEETLYFLDLLAVQAAVAIATAQLHESERRQRQIAEMMLETSSAVASSLDLGQVLLTLSRHLLELSGYHMCAISEWDQENHRLQALAEYNRAVWPPEGGEVYDLEEHPATTHVLTSGEPYVIDVDTDDVDEAELKWMREVGLGSLYIYPLRSGKRIIGLAEVGSVTPGLALSHASQHCEQILDEAASWLAAPLTDNPADKLQELAQALIEASGAGSCTLSAWCQNTVNTTVEYSQLVWPSGSGPTADLANHHASLKALQTGKSVVVYPDDGPDAGANQDDLTRWGSKTLVLQPLSHKGRPIGLIELYNVQGIHEPGEEELELWRVMADQTTVAIANARLAQQISTARDRLLAILGSIHDGILMFDVNGHLVMANPRAEYLLNIRAGDYIGRHFLSIIRETSRLLRSKGVASKNELRDLINDIQDNPGLITRRRYTLNRPTPRTIEEMSVAVLGDNDELLGRLLILRDVTQEYELEAYRQDMSNMIVHDLRSPLGGVISSLYVALDEFTISPDNPNLDVIKLTLEVALGSANNLLKLIETLLNISRLETGEMPLVLEPLNLRHLAENSQRVLESTAISADIEVKIQAPDDLPDIVADREKMERVLNNLLDNALRFTPDGGRVCIEIRPEERSQTVAVTDTGTGIPPEHRERIFERFVQLDARPQRPGSKGSGLGLTFCMLAVEAHGGRIWVDDGPEGGAAFHFTIPSNLEPSPPQESEDEEAIA